MSVGNNLKSYSDLVEAGQLLILPHHPRRERLFISDLSDTSVTDLRYWVGPLAPPQDVSTWFKVTDHPDFTDGVAGPIYFGEVNNREDRIAFMSTITEEAYHANIADILPSDNLVDENDDFLTDASGNFLVTPV